MFKHMMKLIWNRKGSNGLIIAEIVIAFLVVFGVASLGYSNYRLYHQPLGFKWQGGLHVMIRNGGDWTEEDGRALEQALNVLRDNPQIESASALLFGPFRGWRSTTNFTFGGKKVDAVQNQFSDGAHQAMGMELLEGRWTGPEDIGLDWSSVVINKRLADELFPGESPLGKNIRPPDEEDQNYREQRVVGVFTDFRQMGEFFAESNYVIHRLPIEAHDERAFSLVIYPRPGASVALQEEIVETVQRVAPNWTLKIQEFGAMRDAMLEQVMTPLTVAMLIAGFLILMVGFGLFGVLWQSVTRRTGELGLRRAMGANRQRIYRQIIAEMCLTAGIALALGIFVAIQFPMLGTFKVVDWPTAIGGITIGAGIVIALCFLCSLYPGWLASRRSPAEALHYE